MQTLRSTFTNTNHKLFLNERNGRFCVETRFTSIYSTKNLDLAISRFEKEV